MFRFPPPGVCSTFVAGYLLTPPGLDAGDLYLANSYSAVLIVPRQ